MQRNLRDDIVVHTDIISAFCKTEWFQKKKRERIILSPATNFEGLIRPNIVHRTSLTFSKILSQNSLCHI